MVSAICFRPFPLMIVDIPVASGASILKRTGPHFYLSRLSLSPTSAHRHLLIKHVSTSKIFAISKSSVPLKNGDKDKKKTVKLAAGARAILVCTVGIIVSGGLIKIGIPEAIAGPREMYQKAPRVIAYPHSGKDAMQSLLDVTVGLSKIDPPSPSFRLPSKPSMEGVKRIKMQALRLMQHGKAEDAVKFLQDAYGSYKYDPEPAYHLDMTLVEILICQGKYKEALERDCLENEQCLPSDARIPLYKAIIYTMLDDKEAAKKWWEEYCEAVQGGSSHSHGRF